MAVAVHGAMAPVHEIFQASERLDPDDRMILALMLANTLGDETATEQDAAFAAELARRLDAIQSGSERLPTLEEFDALMDQTAEGRHRAALLAGLDRITMKLSVMGGRPCVRETGMTVHRVLELVSVYADWAVLHTAFPQLEREDIEHSLRFAARMLEDDAASDVPRSVGGLD